MEARNRRSSGDCSGIFVPEPGAERRFGQSAISIRPARTAAGAHAAEVRACSEAFLVQRAARAQLRYPLDNRAQNTIVVVDTNGEILGLVRAPDALVDAIDAVPQKARTTVFFSSQYAAPDLLANPTPGVPQFVPAVRAFLNDPAALTGQTAFSLRAVGNLARPWFPDGELGRPPGPLSIPFERFNIFSTGLQSRLITDDILQHVGFILNANPDVPKPHRNPQVRRA